ncbi:TPA: dynamin family protein [Acinetobacter baumannii]|nr:dynamin family protein [Acinetobacter baumannii]MBT8177303.1 dynamin family protein [Acinetobacter baumannii]HBN5964888.1 dynamin family protein [Acinetobacter baumannii]
MNLQRCIDIENIFSTSLLRCNNDIAKLIGLHSELDVLSQRLTNTKSELVTTLKVFLIGEVKAGKSTLINALVGIDVSPVSIVEATVAIAEIGYSEKPSVKVQYTNGNSKVISHDELLGFWGTDSAILQQAEEIEKFIIKTDKHQFKELLLIDSPGLGTVTIQNEELTKNIMQEVDLALWVFNANHLGQTNIMQQVSELAKLGKPIIAVINKIDEVEDSPDDLVDYMDDNIGEYFKKIFPLSAHQALMTIQSNREYLQYFEEFKQYLKNHVNEKASQVKAESIESSLKAILNTEKIIHESAIRKVEKILQERNDYIEDLYYEKNRFVDDIRVLIELESNHLINDFELNQIIKKIFQTKDNHFLNKITNNQRSLNDVLESEKYKLESIFQNYLNILNEKVYEKYKQKLINIIEMNNNKSLVRVSEFHQKEQVTLQAQLRNSTLNHHSTVNVVEVATTAAVTSAAGGVALAGYAAWFSANAAAVTLGAAVGAIALPVTIVGGAAGAIYGWMKSRKNAEALESDVTQIQSDIAEQIKKQLISSYSNRIDHDFNYVESTYEKALFSGISKSDLRKLINSIDDYIIKLSILN